MAIPSSEFSAVILLNEIDLHCKLISKAIEYLEKAAEHWKKLELSIDDGMIFPPIEIIVYCNTCLSSAHSLSELLFLGKRTKNKLKINRRCNSLMKLLDNPSLPSIENFNVRNDWIHIDERLDVLLELKTYRSYSRIHVSAKELKKGTFALRHFNTSNLSIKFGSNAMLLSKLADEINLLTIGVENAFKYLESNPSNLY